MDLMRDDARFLQMYFVRFTALHRGPTSGAEETKTSLERHCYSNGEKFRGLCRAIVRPGQSLRIVWLPARFLVQLDENDGLKIWDLVRLNFSDDILGSKRLDVLVRLFKLSLTADSDPISDIR